MRYGTAYPDALAARAAERGMDARALTDRDTVDSDTTGRALLLLRPGTGRLEV